MKFTTRTSEYEITKVGDDFILKKTALFKDSMVGIGREFIAKAKDISVFSGGGLEFDEMHTSPIENVDELRQWLKDNGVEG